MAKRKPMKNQTKTFGSSMGKIVLLQGAFDIINWGHIKAFERAKSLGDYLIIALNSNDLIREYKKREPILPFEQKKFIIESCRFVDEVVKATEFSPLSLLKKHNVSVYVLTREWKSSKDEEIAYMKGKGGQVVFSPRFKGVIPTSKIKAMLLEEAKDGYMA